MDLYLTPLVGDIIHLQPLHSMYINELAEAGSDESIWKYLFDGPIYKEFGMAGYVRDLISSGEREHEIPYAIIHKEQKKAVGVTRFLDIQPKHRSLEIATWLAKDYHGGKINHESKKLLLKRAFVDLGFFRVQFRIDIRNEVSIRAIEKIGAKREGVLREHLVLADGTRRSSAVYSILQREWNDEIKDKLEQLLRGDEAEG